MNEDERSKIRREEDREWSRLIDRQLVTAITAIQVLQDQIKELKDLARDLEITLHGEKNNRGLVAMFEAHEDDLIRLKAVMWPDSTDHHGLVKDVQGLLDGRQYKQMDRGNLTKIIVAVITSGAIGLFWRDIKAYLSRSSPVIEEANRPRVTVNKFYHRSDE